LQNFVKAGDLVAGKYRVEEVLGEGGMGVVVCALHLQLDERVAIKFLLPDLLSIPEAVQRFTREARAAVKIKNEHVARVFDVGTLDSGAPYMVMEYLEGDDLAAWLERRGPLPVELAVDFVLEACEALAEAHAIGIVHRDLKPANLFCTRRPDGTPSIKVLDFGISRMTGTGGSAELGLTKSSIMMGSPCYMSPEQMRTPHDVDFRADIWALGAILHELIVGRPPFPGESLPEVCLKITTAEPDRLGSLKPGVPPALDAVVLKCLEKVRDRRYPDVASLAAALAPFASERVRASAQRITNVPSKTAVVAGASAATATESPSSRARSRKWPIAIATLSGALAAGVGALVWMAREQPARRAPGLAMPASPLPPAVESKPPAATTVERVESPAALPSPPDPSPAGRPAPAVRPTPVRSGGHRSEASHRATKGPARSSSSSNVPSRPTTEPPMKPGKSTTPAPPRGLIDDRR
jgi:eukaryotic-like serine/threonine-protein kinase